jgi:endonuclease/exonuclease/phosphatase family metal-dependent hydrolase
MPDHDVVVTPAEDVPEVVVPAKRPWGKGTKVAVVLAALWLVFTALHRILSGRAWFWGPADVAPPFLFAVVPLVFLGVAQATRARWRLTVISLLTLTLGWGVSGINLATLWYTPPPAPPGAIHVVSWNTEYWDQDWSGKGAHDSTDFYRYLSGQHADVYLLQEYAHLDLSLPDVFAQAQVIDAVPEIHRWFPGYHVVAMGRDITLSKFPVLSVQGVNSMPYLPPRLRQVPPAQRDHPDYYTTNALRTDLLIGGRVISFYNVHIDQPPSHYTLYKAATRASTRFNDAKRHASFEAIRDAVEANHNPIVLGGDLNTSPAMGIRRLLPNNLVDHTKALSSIYPFSWKARSFRPYWRVDWLLTTPDVTVNRYELIDTDRRSDHRMQRVVMSFGG